MSDQLHDRALRAGAAVQERAADLPVDDGLEGVVRRGRRRRAVTGLAVLLVVALAVPGVAWLRGLGDTRIDLAPADEPDAGPPGEQDEADDGGPLAGGDTEPGELEPGDTEPAPGPTPLGPFGTEDVTAGDFPSGGGEVALLTDVRIAGHDGFDRVVLALDGPDLPSYVVRLVEPPILQGGSGEEVAVAGEAFIEIILTPASGVDSRGVDWVPVYEGPARVTGDTGVVTEVVRIGDFEATLSWAVGLRARQPFAVTVLPDPWRLVVDISTA